MKHAAKKKSSPFLRVLFTISVIILAVALICLGYIFYTYWKGQNEYEQLTEYMQVDDASANQLSLASFDVDWDALRAINADVVGWVYVPDTIINYPIVWRENDDVYYTTHTFNDNSTGAFGAEYGCVALSGANSPDWTDQANFISGHHMQNGTMFATLFGFQDNETFNSHRTFYVLTPEGNFRLTSFAVDKVLGSSTDIVIPNFGTKPEFREYLQARFDTSLVTPDPAEATVDSIEQIMAFYTCSEPDDQYRIMVYCNVDEFLPAGSKISVGNSLVDSEDVSNVQEATQERIE